MPGVCGVGMAGVAWLLARRGWRVSGCDAHPTPALAEWLRGAGVAVAQGHDPAHLADADRVIVTPAVPASEPELAAAREKGIPVFRRGEVLAALVSQGRGVAVCGAHGKTTTSCFTARLLQALGAGPGWCIGGATRQLGAVAGGREGRTLNAQHATRNAQSATETILVAEADESDGTLALYAPAVTVLTNIDLDHLEHFDGEAALAACFRSAVERTREGVAVCRDNARAWAAAQAARVPVLGFGFSEQAELRAADVRSDGGTVSFTPVWRGRAWGRVTLGVPGRHNALNALGAASAVLLLGYEPDAVFEALPRACGELPGRRFERVAEVSGCRFVADYAHHPAELSAAVEMAREQRPGRLVAVFQPHRYTRTLALGPEFPAAFAAADEVILLPVYAASETPVEGGGAEDLYTHFREQEEKTLNAQRSTLNAQCGTAGPRVKLARGLEEAWNYLRQTVREGDLVLIAGAGDVIGMADLIRADVARGWPARKDPEGFETALAQVPGAAVTAFGGLAEWSFYGVGGRARWRVEVADETALAAVVRLCGGHGVPWLMVGAGANSWFSDLGEPGCVIRFAPGAFREFEVRGGETRPDPPEGGTTYGTARGAGTLYRLQPGEIEVAAGCGWPGPALLDRLEREELSGIECLEGVPGTLGGWLAMNAGAHGGEIGMRVAWIRCLNPDGETTIVGADDCGFFYRRCAGLEGRVALACGLRLERSDGAAVKALRQAVRAKRIPLAGLRTEGSVFRNPAGGSAGGLLDRAGCKGLRIGGACVTEFHANIVAVDGTATASDVLALAMRMRGRVARGCGVTLEPEVSGLSF
jgi:UDP-N-acetylmuramate--L-alanine ligase/UDP-N-acetylenolpyruvoylglucosamine reductase